MAGGKVDAWLEALQGPQPSEAEGPAARAITEMREGRDFEAAFDRLLAELKDEYAAESAELDKHREQLVSDREQMRRDYADRVVEFLARAQPGALTPAAREVVREKGALFRRLDLSVETLNSRVIKATETGEG